MNKKIILTESELCNIIKESINNVLRESSSPLVYHYCGLNSLVKMINSNTLFLSNSEQEFNGEDKYYMSLTRNRNSVQGYPYMNSLYSLGGGTRHNCGSPYLYCRLCIDGNALNIYNNIKGENGKQYNFKVKPFDFLYNEFGGTNGKLDALYNDDEEEIYHQPFSQAEDRIIANYSKIPNMNKFVKEIDIFFDINEYISEVLSNRRKFSSYFKEIEVLKELCNNNNINVYIKRDSFNLSNKQYLYNNLFDYIQEIFNKIKVKEINLRDGLKLLSKWFRNIG